MNGIASLRIGSTAFSLASGVEFGKTYTALVADGGIQGWDTPTTISTAFLDYTVSVADNTDLQVYIEQLRNLSDLDLSPNQAAVVAALAEWDGGANELERALLDLSSDEEALAGLSALTGQVNANLTSTLLHNNRSVWRMLDGPLVMLRENADAAAQAVESGEALASLDCSPLLGRGPLLWFSGAALSSRSRRTTDTGRDKHTGSEFSVGGEFARRGWEMGLAFRYADTRMKVNSRSSRADTDNYQLALYTNRRVRVGDGMLRLTVGVSGGYHDLESRRSVNFGVISQSLKADYHAWSLSSLAEIGYRMDVTPRLAVEPYLAGAWDSLWTRSYRESGGSAALQGRGNHQGNFSTTLGSRFAYRLSDRVTANLGAGWRHTYGSTDPHGNVAFVNSPTRTNFAIIGSRLTRDEFVGNIGLRADLGRNVFVNVDYTVNAGGGNFAQQGTFTVGMGF